MTPIIWQYIKKNVLFCLILVIVLFIFFSIICINALTDPSLPLSAKLTVLFVLGTFLFSIIFLSLKDVIAFSRMIQRQEALFSQALPSPNAMKKLSSHDIYYNADWYIFPCNFGMNRKYITSTTPIDSFISHSHQNHSPSIKRYYTVTITTLDGTHIKAKTTEKASLEAFNIWFHCYEKLEGELKNIL